MMPQRKCACRLVAILVLFLLAPMGRSQEAEPSLFQFALNRLSVEGKTAILAEGAPVPDQGTKEAVNDILTASLPFSQKVQRIAELFDYSVRPTDAGFLLNKKYTRIDDLPCVTPEELEAFTENVQEIVRPFLIAKSSQGDAQKTAFALYDSLSPAQQKQALEAGAPVRSLTSPQSSLYESWKKDAVTENVIYAAQVFQVFLGDTQKGAVVIRKAPNGSEGVSFTAGGAAVRQTHLWDWEDRHLPPGAKKITQNISSVPAAYLTSDALDLSAAVTQYCRRSDFEVSPAIAEKPVTIAGAKYTQAEPLFRSLAKLYDLRIASTKGVSRIERRTVRAGGFDTLENDLRLALPLPLRTALKVQTEANKKRDFPKDNDCNERAALYAQALKPAIQKSKNGSLPFPSLPARARAAVALFVMTGANQSDLLENMGVSLRRLAIFEQNAPYMVIRCRPRAGDRLDFEVGYAFGDAVRSGWHGIGGFLQMARP